MNDPITFPIPEKEVYKLVKKAVHTLFKGNPSREQFDDLVQDTMVRILEVIHHYDSTKGSFSNFIYMQVRWAIWRDMVHYSAKSRLRDYQVHSLDYLLPNSEDNETLLFYMGDDQEVQKMNQELFVNDILKNFNDNEKSIIKDYFLKKRKVTEMARELNINNSTLHLKINKLKRKLKEVIDENYL